MISYYEYIVPAIALLYSFYKFAKVYKLIADRGQQIYVFKQVWWKHLADIGLGGVTFLIVIAFAWNKLNFDSVYIIDKYYQDPRLLFNSDYYLDLRSTLRKSNSPDYESLRSLKFIFSQIPTAVILISSILSTFLPRILSAGLYTNGIFDGFMYYPYDDLRSYTTETVNEKVTITFKCHKQTLFHNDKEVVIKIYEDELTEVESYLRYEIRDISALEHNLKTSSKTQKQPRYE